MIVCVTRVMQGGRRSVSICGIYDQQMRVCQRTADERELWPSSAFAGNHHFACV